MSSPTPQLTPEALASLPRHVAVIMDGNGRWAKERGLPRIEGHRQGAESARTIIRAAGELGINYLTLYAFSVENWNRPKDEVDALMKYLVHYLKSETSELNKNNVRLEVIGQIYRLPENVQEHLRKSIQTLSRNNGLTLIMALSYGGRTEIVEAVRALPEGHVPIVASLHGRNDAVGQEMLVKAALPGVSVQPTIEEALQEAVRLARELASGEGSGR